MVRVIIGMWFAGCGDLNCYQILITFISPQFFYHKTLVHSVLHQIWSQSLRSISIFSIFHFFYFYFIFVLKKSKKIIKRTLKNREKILGIKIKGKKIKKDQKIKNQMGTKFLEPSRSDITIIAFIDRIPNLPNQLYRVLSKVSCHWLSLFCHWQLRRYQLKLPPP